MAAAEKTYSSKNIQVLEGLDPVRKRPGMYIGSTGAQGLHHLVYEVVDNSIDEAMAGYCKNITVTIEKDNIIKVEDDGRGIPVDMHPKLKISALEVVMTKLHAGGKFDNETYKVSGGLHGVGVSVVNALSTELIAEVNKDGKLYRQVYHRGIPEEPVKEVGTSKKTGTTVTFKADDEIFETTVYDYKILANRLRELAFLNRGIRITLVDEREAEVVSNEFYYEGGIEMFITHLNENKKPLHDKHKQPFLAIQRVSMILQNEYFHHRSKVSAYHIPLFADKARQCKFGWNKFSFFPDELSQSTFVSLHRQNAPSRSAL